MARARVDRELVRRGLVESREAAALAISAGLVLASGAPVDKSSRMVDSGEPLSLLAPPSPFVSRGGQKLAGALQDLTISVPATWCLDLGASTGGFTDCLLQNGAACVAAVDVGRGQLHERLRRDPRVVSVEGTHILHLSMEELRRRAGPALELDGAPGLVVADLAFISLSRVVGHVLDEFAGPASDLVLLVKPQFEATRAELSSCKRAIVRSPQIWRASLLRVAQAIFDAGGEVWAVAPCRVKGSSGNQEFFVHARKRGSHSSCEGGPPMTDAAKPTGAIPASVHSAIQEALTRLGSPDDERAT
jgi:23S rRNA (cytidine1920-2'-O)/16S rRNA (cytidine1409-2'-O)-methyltransferase